MSTPSPASFPAPKPHYAALDLSLIHISRHDADKADGGERKKAQPLHSGLLKLVVDDKVGGRADQRQHAAHTAVSYTHLFSPHENA